MELSPELEEVVIDYVTLEEEEMLKIRNMLIAIMKREQPEKLRAFLGYEQEFVPNAMVIESPRFIWEFKVRPKPKVLEQ